MPSDAVERIKMEASELVNEFKIHQPSAETCEALTPEEANEFLAHPLNIPDFARRYFGEAHMKELEVIMKSKVLTDIDFLELVGDMRQDEAIEYALVLNEVQDVIAEIITLAEKMAATVEKKISYYIKDIIDGRRINTQQLQKILAGATDLCSAILSKSIGGKMHAFALIYFWMVLHGKLSQAIHKALSQQYPRQKTEIIGQLQSEDLKESMLLGRLPTGTLLKTIQRYEEFFKQNGHHFAKLFTHDTDSSAPTDEGLKEMFDEIRVLSQFRSISFSAEVEGITFEYFTLIGAENIVMNLSERAGQICKVNVSSSSAPKNTNGFGFTIHRVMNGRLMDGYFDISYIIGEDAERHLRHTTYRLLLDYLRKKPDDIKSVPTTVAQRVKEVVKKIVAAILPEKIPETTVDQPRDLDEDTATVELQGPQQEIRERVKSSTGDATAHPPALKKTPRVRKITLANLKGFSGNRIRTALDGLLGAPLRIRGSHHVYRCRDGTTYPIPLHGADQVGTGLLGECLRRFGLPPQELYDRLQ